MHEKHFGNDRTELKLTDLSTLAAAVYSDSDFEIYESMTEDGCRYRIATSLNETMADGLNLADLIEALETFADDDRI